MFDSAKPSERGRKKVQVNRKIRVKGLAEDKLIPANFQQYPAWQNDRLAQFSTTAALTNKE
jgi:hypothetical protein